MHPLKQLSLLNLQGNALFVGSRSMILGTLTPSSRPETQSPLVHLQPLLYCSFAVSFFSTHILSKFYFERV